MLHFEFDLDVEFIHVHSCIQLKISQEQESQTCE